VPLAPRNGKQECFFRPSSARKTRPQAARAHDSLVASRVAGGVRRPHGQLRRNVSPTHARSCPRGVRTFRIFF